MPAEVDVIIIGAGVVGLAIAAELSLTGKKVVVFEKNRTFGLETSSHNSEVIHAGMYYPENSLKARFCVRGNALLYEICDRFSINHQKIGKLIVAADDIETKEIESCTVRDLQTVFRGCNYSGKTVLKNWSPMSGPLPRCFPLQPVLSIRILCCGLFTVGRKKTAWISFLIPQWSASPAVTAAIGSASKMAKGFPSYVPSWLSMPRGLFSDRVAALAGINPEKAGYRLRLCKGEISFGPACRSAGAPPGLPRAGKVRSRCSCHPFFGWRHPVGAELRYIWITSITP